MSAIHTVEHCSLGQALRAARAESENAAQAVDFSQAPLWKFLTKVQQERERVFAPFVRSAAWRRTRA